MALAAILRSVPPEMHVTLAVKEMAKEAWDAIKSMRIGNARVCEAKAQALLKEFDGIRMRSGETIAHETIAHERARQQHPHPRQNPC